MIHPTADVSPDAAVGPRTRIWNEAQVRERATVGADCNIGKGAYIDCAVVVGDRVKVHTRASLFQGVTVENGVFIGPHATFTNDLYPRAVHPDGRPIAAGEWEVVPTLVREGAAIGAGSVIVCGITIGRWAMVAAGSVVTRDVPDHALVMGHPARVVGYVCACGRRLEEGGAVWRCGACPRVYRFEGAQVSPL